VVEKVGYSKYAFGPGADERAIERTRIPMFYTFTRSLATTDPRLHQRNGGDQRYHGQAQVPENIQLLASRASNLDQRLRLTYYNSTNVPRITSV